MLQTCSVQTVHLLHMRSNLAHLDISSSNIMLRKEGYSAWDQLRLLDFGFAQYCSEGEMLCWVGTMFPLSAVAGYAITL